MELDKIGERKTAMFMIMSDTDGTFNFILAMMQSQMFNLLCECADDLHNGKLPVHVRFLLDEFANIGQIPQFDKLIATIRSREISASIILQSKSQLKAIYKDNADTIEGNCDTTLFLGGKEKTTLKEMSEILGKETIDLYNTSDTRGNSPSYGLNYQKTGKEDMERIEELIRKAEHKEAYPFGFDVKQFKTDFATLMAVLEEASAKTEEEPVIEEVVTEETKTVSFKDVLKDIFEGLFSKITDPKVQEMLLKQIRALV